ncbi:hypothetical protein AAIB46_26475 [Streptomyces sp. 35M1]|uniref:hypothetical protein n=1 Tax=Streptomyces sp. 35M1 TaxID=3142978 RepID=UPI003990970B
MPDEIREYWVEVDGVRWPVKQVISLATGAKRSRFQRLPLGLHEEIAGALAPAG